MFNHNVASTEADAEELRSILLVAALGRHDNIVVRCFALDSFIVILTVVADADFSSLPPPSLETEVAASSSLPAPSPDGGGAGLGEGNRFRVGGL
jgi:hypothetical protein